MELETALAGTCSSVNINGKPFQAWSEPADYWKWIAEGRYNHEWKVYDAYLKPEHSFVDLGAWVGAHSMYASRIVKRIDAVEPDPVANIMLLKNLCFLEPRPEVHLHQTAIGIDGTVTLGSGMLGASTTRENLAAGGGIGGATVTFESKSASLSNLCEDIPDPLFIKMDIEGSEEHVFLDLVTFFTGRKPTLLIELHPFWWKDELQTWDDFAVLKSGYKRAFEVPHPNSRMWVLTND